MKIFLIVARALNVQEPWILGAWDEWTIDENPTGFQEAVEEAIEKNKTAEVRVGCVEVPDEFMERIFEPIVVKGKPTEP
jgi:uncharacterized protein YciU (UPF0263 family)